MFARPFYIKGFEFGNHFIEEFVCLLIWVIMGGISQKLYSQYQRLSAGIKGELKTQKILLNLPKDFHVLPNIEIEFEGKKSEIDNLIMSTKGLVIIETKSYNGKLEGKEDDNEWTYIKTSRKGNVYTKTVRSPLKQAKRQTFILSKLLKEKGVHCWIDYYVYILEAQCFVSSDKIFLDERSLVHKIVSSGKENSLTNEDIKKIKDILDSKKET